MVKIVDVAADKATYLPGEAAQVAVTIASDDIQNPAARLVLELTSIDKTVATHEQALQLAPNSTSTTYFTLTPPPTPLRGYGLDVTLLGADNGVLAEGSGALDVLERWSQAPRYGFLSQFAPGDGEKSERYASLRRYHLNVVQFYDWMWRHYKLLPPGEEFTDALDRRMSLASVRRAIAAVQGDGAAALAYGAVYGAEPEYALEHPDLILYDEDNKPISLAELFYIMDMAADKAWFPLIVAEFGSVVRELDFDGIHLDQYGFPKTAQTMDGKPVDLADDFPPLIDAARSAVVAEKPNAGVIFNAVTNWPIEKVAPTTEDAVYIEVWPPYESYGDLRRLINDAKILGGKQVILAAYIAPFLDATDVQLPGAEAAALLAAATIAASGGSHLLLGEDDGILCDPYYPKYATMRPEFAAKMRDYYDFMVRYEELLVSPEAKDGPSDSSTPTLEGARSTTEATAGAVWIIERQVPGYRLLHLINLTDQDDIGWNALRTTPQVLTNLRLRVPAAAKPRQILLLTPDSALGRPMPAAWTQQDAQIEAIVPVLATWTVVLIEVERSE